MDDSKTNDGMDDNNVAEFERLLNEEPGYLPTPLRRGEIRNAIILEIGDREIIVDLSTKQDGVVREQDLTLLDEEVRSGLAVGDEIPVYVLNPRDQSGNLVVSINMGLQRYDWDRARDLLTSEGVETVKVTLAGE